jgi:hypothetical protein
VFFLTVETGCSACRQFMRCCGSSHRASFVFVHYSRDIAGCGSCSRSEHLHCRRPPRHSHHPSHRVRYPSTSPSPANSLCPQSTSGHNIFIPLRCTLLRSAVLQLCLRVGRAGSFCRCCTLSDTRVPLIPQRAVGCVARCCSTLAEHGCVEGTAGASRRSYMPPALSRSSRHF